MLLMVWLRTGGWYIYAVFPPHDLRCLRVVLVVLLTLTLILGFSDTTCRIYSQGSFKVAIKLSRVKTESLPAQSTVDAGQSTAVQS